MYNNIVEECILVSFFSNYYLIDACLLVPYLFTIVIEEQYLLPNFILSMIWFMYLIPGIL